MNTLSSYVETYIVHYASYYTDEEIKKQLEIRLKSKCRFEWPLCRKPFLPAPATCNYHENPVKYVV